MGAKKSDECRVFLKHPHSVARVGVANVSGGEPHAEMQVFGIPKGLFYREPPTAFRHDIRCSLAYQPRVETLSAICSATRARSGLPSCTASMPGKVTSCLPLPRSRTRGCSTTTLRPTKATDARPEPQWWCVRPARCLPLGTGNQHRFGRE